MAIVKFQPWSSPDMCLTAVRMVSESEDVIHSACTGCFNNKCPSLTSGYQVQSKKLRSEPGPQEPYRDIFIETPYTE
jgi:hypothetical protein